MPAGIALVDDNFLLCEMMSLFLQRKAPNHPIHICHTAAQALALCEHKPICCMLTDYSLSDMDGAALTQIVTAQHPTIPVFLLTGYTAPDIHEEARQAGCLSVLVKPVSLILLWDTISPHLDDTTVPLQSLVYAEGAGNVIAPSAERVRSVPPRNQFLVSSTYGAC